MKLFRSASAKSEAKSAAKEPKNAEAVENTGSPPLRPNMLVEVLTAKNVLSFVGRVQEFDGKMLTVKDAKDGQLPLAVYNQAVKLRFFQKDQVLVLEGQICGSTDRIWRVDRLEGRFGAERRVFFRQSVNLDALVKPLQPQQPAASGTPPIHGRVLDISVGGLLLRCPAALQEGDQLSVSGIRIPGQTDLFSFSCSIRRVQAAEGQYLYGCKFDPLSPRDEDRLLQAVFSLQRETLSKHR